MTDVRVVDASAIGALLFSEPQAEFIVQSIDTMDLIAPTLLWYELSNVCLKKLAAYPSQANLIRQGLSFLVDLQIKALTVDHAAVVDLAAPWKLTAYDASYLWLALNQQCPLLTLDKALLKVAARLGAA